MAKEHAKSKILYIYIPEKFFPELKKFSNNCKKIQTFLNKREKLPVLNSTQSFIIRYFIQKFNESDGGKLNPDNYPDEDENGRTYTKGEKEQFVEHEVAKFLYGNSAIETSEDDTNEE